MSLRQGSHGVQPMRKAATAAKLAPITEDVLDRCHRLGLRVITYTNKATEPVVDGGRRCWIPRDCIAEDAKGGITFRISEGDRRDCPGATYRFDGWEPWADGRIGGAMFGGRYERFESALAWYEHALKIRSGEASHF